MFGGAYFDPQRGQHITIDEHLWKFNFEKLEWSKLSSLTMIKPSYFHAAAMNEVMIALLFFYFEFLKHFAYFSYVILFSAAKYGLMEVL